MPTLRSVETEPQQHSKVRSRLQTRILLLLTGFSIFYFADVCARASEKYFWFDELGTVFQCRLSLPGLWDALRAAFDFNPPLLYLLTKLANSLFSEGLIVTRLPEIIGFWIFSICIFQFVNRRAGALAGFSAMVLPMASGAFYYAYDARPHGLVLCFCGLALITWQMSLEPRRQNLWLLLFSFALFAAFMTHCYAITLAAPFGVVELSKTARSRRIEYRRWAALGAPVLLAGMVYVPLLHAFEATIGGTYFLNLSPPSLTQVASFYQFLLTPCLLIVLLIVTLLALNAMGAIRSSTGMAWETPDNFQLEIALALNFLALPIFGLLLAIRMHSPFYDRYFLSALAGFCILVGFGVGLGKRVTRAPALLAGVMAFWLLFDVSSVVWHRSHGWAERLAEPSSGFSANSSLQGPLANYEMLVTAAKKGKRIVVLWPIEFLYLVNYAPEIRSQLYYIGWSDQDPFLRILVRVHPYVPFAYYAITPDEFYASKADFMLFGVASDAGQLQAMAGYNVQSMQISNDRFLAEVSLKAPKI